MTDVTRTTDQKRNQERGVLLVNILVIMAALLIIGTAVASHAASQYASAKRNVFTTNALLVAEAGIEESLKELNQDSGFQGFQDEQEFFNDESQGRGIYTTVVEDVDGTEAKTITSWAEVYRYGETEEPVDKHGVRVTVVGTGSQGYSVHTGPGGLILSGSASITNSDVFVNGYIQMSGAARIGTSSEPAQVDVANYRCPLGSNPGPTYPEVCGPGQQPISLQWSTFIYGTVCATHQTDTGPNPSGNIRPGSTGAGLVPGCVAAPVSPPTYDRQSHIDAVEVTGSGSNNSYVCNNWPFERDWPADLQLNGNVNIGGSCDVTINGDVYITGNLTLGGAAKLRVADSLGGTVPHIIVDGTINVGGSATIIANSSGTGAHFISFKSSASCNPDCTDISGTELHTSQNEQTVTIGGGVNMPGMIFGAYWGKIRIAGSGNIGAAYGQTVDMSGAGTVTFGTELSSGASTWTITSYQQLYE